MRIAEIATLGRPVPPAGEGSVESIVHLVTEGLVSRGHEVTLFATADSNTQARLLSPVQRSYINADDMWDWQLYESYNVRQAFSRWKDFDIIHCHSYHFGLLYCDFVPIPTLHSFHTEPGPDYRFLAKNAKNYHLHCCSRFQAQGFAPGSFTVFPHAVPCDNFHVAREDERENYLLFIGRFTAEKGIVQAIDIAKGSNLPLKIAAPENEYFRSVVAPMIDGTKIQYVGEVAGSQKADLLTRARALLYPVQRAEPFGLVLAEAMASGLPTLALNRGAVPEIVVDGVTGYLAESEEELLDKVSKVDRLDRNAIRRIALERFHPDHIIDCMEDLMKLLVNKS